MFSKLFKKSRADDSNKQPHEQSDRIFKKDNFWFFNTREGMEVGPFNSRQEARYALLYFVESSHWPTPQQLASFIEGCELIEGIRKE